MTLNPVAKAGMSSSRRPSRVLPHNDSRQVAELFAGAGAGALQQARAKATKGPNYAAANAKRVREKSEQNRLAKLEGSSGVGGAPAASPLGSRNAGSCGGGSARSSSTGDQQRPAGRGSGRDFVRENAENVASRIGRHANTVQQRQLQPLHCPGDVPDYLVRRKMELAAQYAEQQVRAGG